MTGLGTGGVLLFWALGSGSGLRVETSTPDALCPDLGQVRAAARARLGDIEAEGDWNASYALIHRPDGVEAGDIVRLTLHDPAGRLRLQRELPRAGESCASLAQALVVILDAYFRHPTDTEELAAPAPAPEPVVRATAVAPAAPPPSERLAVDLSAGWSGAWRGADRQSPVLALGFRASLAPLWWAGVEGTWLTSSETQTFETPSGPLSASLRSYGLRGFVARDLLHGPGTQLLVGPEVLVGLDRADGAMLIAGSRETRPSFGAGLRAQLRLRLVQALWLSVLATLDYTPGAWGGTFAVADSPTHETEIFPPSRLRLMVGAGLSWTVF
jgi:hypothetical protein